MTLALASRRLLLAESRRRAVEQDATGALDRLAASWQRPVTLFMLGDSHQLFNGYGMASALPKALASLINLYATPIFDAAASVSGEYNASHVAPPGATTGLPADFEPYRLKNYIYADGSQASVSGSNGVNMGPSHDLNPNAALRANYWYGTWLSSGGAFNARVLNLTSGATVADGGTTSVTTGAYGIAKKTIDVPAGDRGGAGLKANWQPASAGAAQWASSPMVAFAAQIERPDRVAGLCCQTLYGSGGQSLRDMAAYLIGLSDTMLTNIVALHRQQQLARGFSPRFVFYVNSGHNDRNETDPSLGPHPTSDGDSAEAYIDNLDAIENRLAAIWALNGWSRDEFALWSVVSYQVATTPDAELTAYAEAAKAWAKGSPLLRTCTALQDVLTYATDVQPYLADGLHSTNAGYDHYATAGLLPRVVERLPGPVFAEPVSISGTVAPGLTITAAGATVKSGTTVAYQWVIGGVDKAGATGTTYVVQAEDAGKTIQLRATATRNGQTLTIASNTLTDTTRLLADYAGGTFFGNGQSFASKAAFLTGMGFTEAGNTRYTTAPVVGDNLLTTTASGFAVQSGVSIADISGGVRVTRSNDGAVGYASQSLALTIGEAYRADWLVTTVSGNILVTRMGTSIGNSGYFGNAVGGTVSQLIAPTVATSYVSFGDSAAANNGVGDVTGMSVKPARRYPGIAGIAETVLVDFTPSAGQTVDEVLWQADLGAETNRRRIVRSVSDGHVRLIATHAGGEVANVDLGAAPAGSRYKAITVWASNDFDGAIGVAGALNGTLTAAPDTAGALPAVAYERHGRSFAGDAFTGTLHKVQIWEGRLADAVLTALTG